MKRLRFFLKRILRLLPIPVVIKETALFRLKLGYWPDFSEPKTFSEKLHFRKLHETDQRLVSLSDKLKVRNFVEACVGPQYLIPLIFEGASIQPEDLYGLGDNIIVKRNSDSGSVYPIESNTLEDATKICSALARKNDYGKTTNEWWYREMPNRILVEPLLFEPGEHRPIDYKFFVFDSYLFVEVIRRRKDGGIECGFYDEDLKPLEHKGRKIEFNGCLPFTGQFPAKETFSEMVSVAKRLSRDFNFLRVDLYSVGEKVYFGELTFCPSEGRMCLSPVEFDRILGDRWASPVLLSESGDPEFAISNN